MGERASSKRSAGDRKQKSETGPKEPKERGRENVAGESRFVFVVFLFFCFLFFVFCLFCLFRSIYRPSD